MAGNLQRGGSESRDHSVTLSSGMDGSPERIAFPSACFEHPARAPLGVVPQLLANAGDGRPVVQRAVVASRVVKHQPGGEGRLAGV